MARAVAERAAGRKAMAAWQAAADWVVQKVEAAKVAEVTAPEAAAKVEAVAATVG